MSSVSSRPRARPRARTAPPLAVPASRSPLAALRSLRDRRARGRLVRIVLLAGLSGILVPALGGGETYWVCVPALLLVAAGSRTREGTAAGCALIVAASLLPTALSRGLDHLPPLTLALLVPAASAAVVLALRERLERERDAMRLSALTDQLTGVANRRSLLARTEYEIVRHSRARRPFGIVMLDLDGFKQLNDRFGHAAGDDLLVDVAEAINGAIRDQDTVARMGGDEFCVLAPETDLLGTEQLAARALSAVSTVTAGIDTLGASAGVSSFPLDGKTIGALLDAADQRLLDVKRRRPHRRVRRAA